MERGSLPAVRVSSANLKHQFYRAPSHAAPRKREFVVYFRALSVLNHITHEDQNEWKAVNNELQRIWKGTGVNYLKALLQIFQQ